MPNPYLRTAAILSAAVALSVFQGATLAQSPDRSVTVFQYRHVPADNVADFVHRETTYWSQVAQKAVDSKTMTFWAVLQQVGGTDLPNSPNFLFINTFPNIDGVAGVFDAAAQFPGVPMAAMDTNALSTTTGQFYLHDENRVYAAGAVPQKDFQYVVINYHNSSDPASFIALEKQYWMPFIETAMNQKQTSQKGWANARVLAPRGDAMAFNTVSYDLFSSLHQALMPEWTDAAVFPEEGLDKLGELRLDRMDSSVYRIIRAISAN